MAATTPAYQTVTILAILVGAGLLIFMAVLFTQNQSKWTILDSFQKELKGPVSQLRIGYPGGVAGSVSASMSVQDLVGKEQFANFVSLDSSGKPILNVASPTGSNSIAMNQPPM